MTDKDKIIAEQAARISELEDILLELAPFAACYDVKVETTLAAPTDELAKAKGMQFKRDTLYMNKHVYRRAAHLVKDKIIAAGMDYIFE